MTIRTGIAAVVMVAAAGLLPGCVAKTALNLATMPVKATAQAADWATTSQDEADRNHGRKLRKRCAKNYEPEYCDR